MIITLNLLILSISLFIFNSSLLLKTFYKINNKNIFFEVFEIFCLISKLEQNFKVFQKNKYVQGMREKKGGENKIEIN